MWNRHANSAIAGPAPPARCPRPTLWQYHPAAQLVVRPTPARIQAKSTHDPTPIAKTKVSNRGELWCGLPHGMFGPPVKLERRACASSDPSSDHSTEMTPAFECGRPLCSEGTLTTPSPVHSIGLFVLSRSGAVGYDVWTSRRLPLGVDRAAGGICDALPPVRTYLIEGPIDVQYGW
jgi:hypothetical protein